MASKIPSTLTLVAGLSGGITIVTGLIYTILSSLALMYRFDCKSNAGQNQTASALFVDTLYRVYILEDKCPSSISVDFATKSETIFILTVITLCISVIAMITAISFIAVTQQNTEVVLTIGYVYVAVSVGSLVVDLTLATHFGIDFTTITERLDITNEYMLDLLRLGSFLLMTVALKGFATHAINIVLLIMIVIYLEDYRDIVKRSGHSIHTVGAIDAYEQPKRDVFEQRRDMYNNVFVRSGPQSNPAFTEDLPPRRSLREPQRERPEYNNSRSYDYSNPWPSSQESSGSAPFSYLKDPSRGSSGRDWQPPVPAPDYSPQPRRLKSAMKTY